MADGSTKPIEEIEVGDQVLTRDEHDPEGEATVGTVTRVFRNVSREGLFHVTWSDPADTPDEARSTETGRHTVTTTPGHSWYALDRGWIQARDLRNGDILLTADGRYVAVRHVRFEPVEVPTFNFEVAGTHTYYAGIDGFGEWVHNSSLFRSGKDAQGRIRRVVAAHSGNTGSPRNVDRSNMPAPADVQGGRGERPDRLPLLCRRTNVAI